MGKRKERDSIIFINDHMELAETMLTESELGRLYIALRRYSIEGVVGNFATESSGWRAISARSMTCAMTISVISLSASASFRYSISG